MQNKLPKISFHVINSLTSFHSTLFLGLAVHEITYDTALISWNNYTNMDENQFKEYSIRMKKRYTTTDADTPMYITSLQSQKTISGLEASMDYEISVLVHSVDFGNSEWSVPIMITMKDLSGSAQNEIENLKDQFVS